MARDRKDFGPMRVGVGWPVHYVSYGTPGGEYDSMCRAAIIAEIVGGRTELTPARAALVVLNPKGAFFHENLPQSQDPSNRVGGTWHHPDRHCAVFDTEQPS